MYKHKSCQNKQSFQALQDIRLSCYRLLFLVLRIFKFYFNFSPPGVHAIVDLIFYMCMVLFWLFYIKNVSAQLLVFYSYCSFLLHSQSNLITRGRFRFLTDLTIRQVIPRYLLLLRNTFVFKKFRFKKDFSILEIKPNISETIFYDLDKTWPWNYGIQWRNND